ncbi:MAG: ABC transporter substrate-binding protein [Armatimonadetes bacterium]|nr:ABC transporter substrate-binding protein [Armatimonadota bacterium]
MSARARGCVFLLAALALGSGCRRAALPVSGPAACAAAEDAAALTDDLGRPWQGATSPRRVVSLAPDVTETVCALGARDRLVGIDTASDYPPEVKRIPRVGDFLTPSTERILALRADAVIVSSGTADAASAAEMQARFRAPVFVVNQRRLEDVPRNARRFGRLLGLGARAEALAARLEARLAAVSKAVAGRPRRKVFLEVWHEPLTTIGPRTFLDDLVRLAGGENVAGAARQEYPTISLEALLAAEPDVYIVTTHGGKVAGGDPARRPGFQGLRAIREGRVRRVPADPVLRPTPRLAEGAELMARAIHPEAFPP